jgi:hypothetical protein
MAAEIIAAVSAANQAFNFIKKAVHKGQEIQDLSRAIGAFWDAREEVSVLEQKATNPSKIQKLFGGKSVEAQALEVTLQKQRAENLERELKDIFLWTGNGHLWTEMIRERSRIRNARIAAAKQAAQTKAAMIDLTIIGGTIIAIFIIVMGATSIIV